MRSNGFWLCSRSASWSAPALCLWLCIALLLLPLPIFAQSQNLQLNSIEQRLQNIVIYSQQLEKELKSSQNLSQQRKQIINDQLIELGDLRIELENWKTSDSQKAKRILELLSTIEKLETKLQQLSESYENTVKPLQQALTVAEKEIRRQKIKTLLYMILAAAAAGTAGYGIGKAF